MQNIVFTDKLKNDEILVLEKFIDILIDAVVTEKCVYIDGIGTFYINKHSDSIYRFGYPDELLMLPNKIKIKDSIDFEKLKNSSICNPILRKLRSMFKEDTVIDIPTLGIFKISDTITFKQSLVIEKRINKGGMNVYLKKNEAKKKEKQNEIVEDINEENDNKHYINAKIEDYEELEEIVYNDYKKKTSDKRKVIEGSKSSAVKSKNASGTRLSIENKKLELENEENEETRNLFAENLDNAINKKDNIKSEKQYINKNKKNVKKIPALVILLVAIIVLLSFVSAYFITYTINQKNAIDDNSNIYSITYDFFTTYRATMLSVRLTRDMYLWEISEEVYDDPLYWSLIYAENNIANPSMMVQRGTLISYRDLGLNKRGITGIIHKSQLNKALSKTYILLYYEMVENNERVHAIWCLRLSSYFSDSVFKKYKSKIDKKLYERIRMDTKNYAKRSL